MCIWEYDLLGNENNLMYKYLEKNIFVFIIQYFCSFFNTLFLININKLLVFLLVIIID